MDKDQKRLLRQKLFINREVQGALILRNVLHWCFYMCAILLVISVWTAIRTPSSGPTPITLVFKSFVYFSPAILASLVLMPLFIYDHLKASNKVAGPIYRLQNRMNALIDGEEVKELRFRDGDHWSEIAEDFNRLSTIVNELRREKRLAAECSEEASAENEAKAAMAESKSLESSDVDCAVKS